MTSDTQTDIKMPVKIGRYRVQSILGKGGMSTVYACLDPRIGRDVAVKVLSYALMHDDMFRTRFKREAKMIASLEHPYIVPVHDFGEENEQPFLVMRLMRGKSLTERLAKGPVAPAEIGRIFHRINDALDAAHGKGIIHRDLKPGNILFDQYGNAFLSDFGIARISTGTQASITKTGGAVGTPGYMSPEQIQGHPVDGRSDIYALGILLFEMLTGQKPFRADTPAMVIVKQMTEAVPSISEVEPAIPAVYDELIRLLTSADREERPARASDVSRLLDAIIEDVHGVDDTTQAETAASPPTSSDPPFRTPPPVTPSPPDLTPEPEALPFFDLAPPIIPRNNTAPPSDGWPSLPPETAVHAHTNCPHCHAAVQIDKPTNTITCRSCKHLLPLAGHLCPYCNNYHEIESGFCESCGAAMTRICPQCDAVNWAGVEHCQTCDAGLDIFESLRLHDKRVAAHRRQERRAEIKYFKQIEEEASKKRMAELRGDPAALRRKVARRKIVRGLLFILILVSLAVLATFIYNTLI